MHDPSLFFEKGVDPSIMSEKTLRIARIASVVAGTAISLACGTNVRWLVHETLYLC